MKSDINSNAEIYKRLIKAFSVNSLKQIFNLNGYKERQDDLIDIVIRGNSMQIIENLIFENFSLLKQHVYVYNFLGVLPQDYLLSHPALKSTLRINKNHDIYNFLFPTTFDFFTKTSRSVESIDFLVPVQIHRKGTKLIVQINILERDMSSIIKEKVLSVNRDNNDESILNSFEQATISRGVRLLKCDLNKGIKQLWADDEVDAFKVKFKKAKSTSTEVMDQDKLLKRDMPVVYAELIKTPLIQNTFKVLKQKKMMEYFAVDPTKGVFYFSIYPQFLSGTNDLIDLVLKHN